MEVPSKLKMEVKWYALFTTLGIAFMLAWMTGFSLSHKETPKSIRIYDDPSNDTWTFCAREVNVSPEASGKYSVRFIERDGTHAEIHGASHVEVEEMGKECR